MAWPFRKLAAALRQIRGVAGRAGTGAWAREDGGVGAGRRPHSGLRYRSMRNCGGGGFGGPALPQLQVRPAKLCMFVLACIHVHVCSSVLVGCVHASLPTYEKTQACYTISYSRDLLTSVHVVPMQLKCVEDRRIANMFFPDSSAVFDSHSTMNMFLLPCIYRHILCNVLL